MRGKICFIKFWGYSFSRDSKRSILSCIFFFGEGFLGSSWAIFAFACSSRSASFAIATQSCALEGFFASLYAPRSANVPLISSCKDDCVFVVRKSFQDIELFFLLGLKLFLWSGSYNLLPYGRYDILHLFEVYCTNKSAFF